MYSDNNSKKRKKKKKDGVHKMIDLRLSGKKMDLN